MENNGVLKNLKNDKGLYGDIRNLRLCFQQLYLFCRQPRHIHDRCFIRSLCQHLSGNLKASQVHTLFHAYFYTFSKAFLFCRINGVLLIAYLVAPYLLLNLVNFTVFFRSLAFLTKKIVNLQREIKT